MSCLRATPTFLNGTSNASFTLASLDDDRHAALTSDLMPHAELCKVVEFCPAVGAVNGIGTSRNYCDGHVNSRLVDKFVANAPRATEKPFAFGDQPLSVRIEKGRR